MLERTALQLAPLLLYIYILLLLLALVLPDLVYHLHVVHAFVLVGLHHVGGVGVDGVGEEVALLSDAFCVRIVIFIVITLSWLE